MAVVAVFAGVASLLAVVCASPVRSSHRLSLVSNGHAHLALGNESHLVPDKVVGECGVYKRGWEVMECPSACPFVRINPTYNCKATCVVAEECNTDSPLANFADKEIMRCAPCEVPACDDCIGNKHTCGLCQHGFELLEDGQCYNKSRYKWWTGYAILGFIVVVLLYYLVCLACRKVTNNLALTRGERFRFESRLHNRPESQSYPLRTDLRQKDVAGTGTMLLFDWQFWVLVWSIGVTLVLVGLAASFETRPSAIKKDWTDPLSFQECNPAIDAAEEAVAHMEHVYFWALLVVYILTTIGTLVLAWWHRQVKFKADAETKSASDFTVLAQGLPLDPDALEGPGTLEAKLVAFFQKNVPGAQTVVGVSVCWDYREKLEAVESQCRWELDQLDDTLVQHRNRLDSVRGTVPSSEASEGRSCCDPSLPCIDTILGMGRPCTTSMDCMTIGKTRPEETHMSEEEVKELLASLKTGGSAWVVFNKESEQEAFLEHCEEKGLALQDKDGVSWPLSVSRKDCEPDTVIFSSFGTTHWEFLMNFAKGLLMVVVTIVLLDVFLYFPYVHYLTSYSGVAGMNEGSLVQGTILGFLITICNLVIYTVIQIMCDGAGFLFRGRHAQAYVILYTFAVIINTCVDLWTVLILTAGYAQNSIGGKVEVGASVHGSIDPTQVAEHPALQRLLFDQLGYYLFPGCLLLPFLFEPIFLVYLPHWIGKCLVRSRKDVSIMAAEDCLAFPIFDLSRYGDILVNIMLCNLVLIVTYRDLWDIFFKLVVSLVFIYCWDHFRLLRASRACVYVSAALDRTAMWLLILPCTILAAVLAFRVYGGHDDFTAEVFAAERMLQDNVATTLGVQISVLTRRAVLPLIWGVICAHLALHSALMYWVQTRTPLMKVKEEAPDNEYQDAAKNFPCSFFSANPVHCLRSMYLAGDKPPCAPFVYGKEYLLTTNEKIGLFFDGSRAKKRGDSLLEGV